MDVLSDTLKVVRLSGAVFLRAKLVSPWAVESAPSVALAEFLRLPSDCIAVFHVIARGCCWLTIPDSSPVLLKAGDAVLLPQNCPHIVGSDTGLPTMSFRDILPATLPPEGIVEIAGGSIGEPTQLICGYLHCDQRFNPLIGALPDVMMIHRCDDGYESGARVPASATALAIQPGDWLETTLRHTVDEALGERPGNTDMLARLSEILFVELVRRYMQQLPAAHHGWLAGVRDPIVGQVLRLVHAHPEHDWTVESLAQQVAVSRSTLAQRFTDLIGETPMRYLANWRIQLAKHLLKHSNLNLAEVAQRVGYESAVAFNRAFKRHVGQPPAAWRIAANEQ